MSSLYDALYNENNLKNILAHKKQIEDLDSKIIQDAARKYINLKAYIKATLKQDKNVENTPKLF